VTRHPGSYLFDQLIIGGYSEFLALFCCSVLSSSIRR